LYKLEDFKEGQVWVVGWQHMPDFVCTIRKSFFNEHVVVVRLSNEMDHYLEPGNFKKFLGDNLESAQENNSCYFV